MDGNSEPDAICHDFSTGTRWMAASHGRLVQPAWSSAVPFCNGTTGGDIFVGDYNGDGRTDMMCHPKASGVMTIDYADATGSYHNSGLWSPPAGPMFWCTQPQQHMLTGDVNGDNRSDLICHDTSTGVIGWMLADAAGHFSGTTAGSTAPGFCTRPTDWLYVGEFNSDSRTDLLCVTASTGEMALQYSHSAAIPYNATTDFIFTGNTGVSCPATACDTGAGETCDAGRCTRHFCTGANDDLTVADVTGDNITDVLCTSYVDDGDGNSRNDRISKSSGIRAFGGVSARGGIFTSVLSWATGSASQFAFVVGQGVRIRRVMSAVTTVTPPRNGIRAVTTR